MFLNGCTLSPDPHCRSACQASFSYGTYAVYCNSGKLTTQSLQ